MEQAPPIVTGPTSSSLLTPPHTDVNTSWLLYQEYECAITRKYPPFIGTFIDTKCNYRKFKSYHMENLLTFVDLKVSIMVSFPSCLIGYCMRIYMHLVSLRKLLRPIKHPNDLLQQHSYSSHHMFIISKDKSMTVHNAI